MHINISRLELLILLLFLGCSRPPDFTLETVPICINSNTKGSVSLIKSYPYYDSIIVKEGDLSLYYLTGEVKETSSWKNSHLINENIIYYKNGKIREYRFYNIVGTLCFYRSYDENTNLVEQLGMPFIQGISDYDSSGNVRVGDSVSSEIYIASPPNCTHKIYGIDSGGKYELKWERTCRFIYRNTNIFTEEGDFFVPFEVEFVDTVLRTKQTYSEEFPFSVVR